MNYGQHAGLAAAGQATGYIGGSGGGTQAPVPAPSPVMSAQQHLDDATNGLHMAITALQERLQPVLGPSQPGNDSVNPGPPSSVAMRIAQSAGSVNAAISRLSDILNRLEI